MRTSLSVLVPVYNEQHLVAESLRRLAILDHSPDLARLEVTVVDDCSTDATPAVAAGTIRHRGSSAYVRFWLVASIATAASWIPIYVLTPYDQIWHMTTSLDRLLLQIFPLMLVGILLGFGVSDSATATLRDRAVSTPFASAGH